MTGFAQRVIALSDAAWRLREASPAPCDLPFALALFSDPVRMPPIDQLVEELPDDVPPLAIIFRHDALAPGPRVDLARRVRDQVQERGHLFLMGRGDLEGADGAHGAGRGPGIRTAPAHDVDELAAASAWADAAFLSPLGPTASHPEVLPMTRQSAVALAQASRIPIFALGGMDEETVKPLEGAPFQGFGAIGAFVAEPA